MGLLPKRLTPAARRRAEKYLDNHLSQKEEVGFFLKTRGKKLKKNEKIVFRNSKPVIVKKGGRKK